VVTLARKYEGALSINFPRMGERHANYILQILVNVFRRRANQLKSASGQTGALGALAISAVASTGAAGKSNTCPRRDGSLVNQERLKKLRSVHGNATKRSAAVGLDGQMRVAVQRPAVMAS
jgi:hypothetical protein